MSDNKGEEAEDDDEEPEEEAEKGKVTRRHIYLLRLIGDDITGAKKVAARNDSWAGVIRFTFYAIIATVVITTHAHITQLGTVNRGIMQNLKSRWFKHVPTRKYFDDITSVDEIGTWVTRVLVNTAPTNEGTGDNFVLTFNRITPQRGACVDNAAIMMTLRRIGVTDEYERTTTGRFNKLVPNTTTVLDLPAGSGLAPGWEITDFFTAWHYTAPRDCTENCDEWSMGHKEAGGYVGMITIAEDSAGQANKAWMHMLGGYTLVDRRADREWGTCEPGVTESVRYALQYFPWSRFLDKQLGSLAFDFIMYNANIQSMSAVSVVFETNMGGMVTSRKIHVMTMMLDTFHPWMKVVEFFYLIFTLTYFLELCFRSYKAKSKCFNDVWFWINAISIIASMTSLVVWYLYTPFLLEFRDIDRGFQNIAHVNKSFEYFQLYMWASALAVLTIYLRILQFLSNTRMRVMLLWRTLSMGAGNIFIYLVYVFAVFWGFLAFANTHFSSLSPRFITPMTTFMSCFQMFFGKVDVMDTIDEQQTPLKKPFFVFFMLCFYFISVQMFNAIINFSYNTVSEEMEPQFERERNEQKRKELQLRISGRRSTWAKIRERVMRTVSRQKGEAAKDAAKDGMQADKGKAQASTAPAFDNLDAAVKEKVEAYLTKGHHVKKPDSPFSVFMFICFAIVYLSFLVVNLRVEENYAVKRAVDTAVYQTVVAWGTPYLGQDDYIFWDDITSLPQARHWIVNALPQAIFNSTTDQSNQLVADLGIRDPLVCLRNWNCLISGKQQAVGTSEKIVRMTQRRAILKPNDGKMYPYHPDDSAFRSGTIGGTPVSRILVPMRRNATDVDPYSWPDLNDENTTLADPPLTTSSSSCQANAPGEGGFKRNGGIVCYLDADYSSFSTQIKEMELDGFFGIETGSIVVEFALYNPNQDMLTFTVLSFVVSASGTVEKQMQVISMKLFNIGDFWENSTDIILRILPGVLYLTLVCVFAHLLRSEFNQEQQRKRLQDNRSLVTSAYEFFIEDTFNFLDCISILISVVSAVLFVIWLVEESQIRSKLIAAREGEFADFLFYCSDLGFKAELYNRLSSLNVLIIFVRPLKFVRENARIAQLNQTLFEASTDIKWFVVMLFVTMYGFVIFTYVSFGPYLKECSDIGRTIRYNFNYMLGNFDFDRLMEVEPVMAVVLMPYLLLFYCVFTNIFFAIIDRFFIAAEPPPFQWKRKLKPIFQRICRCVEWDEDYVMEQDPNAEKKVGPPTRRARAHHMQKKLQEIRSSVGNVVASAGSSSKSKALSDVCEVDERMDDVLRWSRDEARKVVDEFLHLLDKKGGTKNDEEFIKKEVILNKVRPQLDDVRKERDEAARHMLYATKVHEQMAQRDQETLAKYVLLLENKVYKKMVEQHALKTEVNHLKEESKKMRFDDGEVFNEDDQLTFDGADQLVDAMQNGGAEDSASSASGSDKEEVQEEEMQLAIDNHVEDFEPASNVQGGRGDPDALSTMHSARRKRDLSHTLQKFEEGPEDV